VQQIVRVDLRTVVMEVPSQDLISRDNVSVKVDAVLYFHAVDPEKSVIQVEHFVAATNLLAQTTLRSVLGQHDLDEMLTERAKLNADIQDILDVRTTAWGIEVTAVEIRDVALTGKHGQGDCDASRSRTGPARQGHSCRGRVSSRASSRHAATILASVPAAMQLRYLQTLSEVGSERNSTIIFPMPIDIIKPFLEIIDKKAGIAAPIPASAVVPTNGFK